MGIEDEYTAFCFDEACAYIIAEIQDDKQPIIKQEKKKSNKSQRASDIYQKYDNVRITK